MIYLFICPELQVSNTLLSHSLCTPSFYLLCGTFYGFWRRGSPLLAISSHRVPECLGKLGESSMEISRTPTPFTTPLFKQVKPSLGSITEVEIKQIKPPSLPRELLLRIARL